MCSSDLVGQGSSDLAEDGIGAFGLLQRDDVGIVSFDHGRQPLTAGPDRVHVPADDSHRADRTGPCKTVAMEPTRSAGGPGADAVYDALVSFAFVRDLDAAQQFYTGQLGLELVTDQGACRIYRVAEGGFLGLCTHRPPTHPTR